MEQNGQKETGGGYVIYQHNKVKNKEKETSVKASIFLGFCG